MSSSAVTHQPHSNKQTSRHNPHDGTYIESREQSASASASAGLNLNIFGAIAGAFSGKSSKRTEADGSSVEHREEQARVKGAGAGTMNAAGAAQAQAREAEFKHIPIGDDYGQIEAPKEQKKIAGAKR